MNKLDKVIQLHVTLSQKLIQFSEFKTNFAKIIFQTDGGYFFFSDSNIKSSLILVNLDFNVIFTI